MGKGHAALYVFNDNGLRIGTRVVSRCTVTTVSHCHVAGTKALHDFWGKCVVDETGFPVGPEDAVVIDRNSAALLATVLEGKQPIISHGCNVGGFFGEDAENTALFMDL